MQFHAAREPENPSISRRRLCHWSGNVTEKLPRALTGYFLYFPSCLPFTHSSISKQHTAVIQVWGTWFSLIRKDKLGNFSRKQTFHLIKYDFSYQKNCKQFKWKLLTSMKQPRHVPATIPRHFPVQTHDE